MSYEYGPIVLVVLGGALMFHAVRKGPETNPACGLTRRRSDSEVLVELSGDVQRDERGGTGQLGRGKGRRRSSWRGLRRRRPGPGR